jgi:hypothetical protein
MADTICVLGQSMPNAGVMTDLVITPLETEGCVISTLFVANQDKKCGYFTVSIARANATDATSQIIYPNVEVFGESTFPITAGITLGKTDVLRVKSSNGQISFTACGTRIA